MTTKRVNVDIDLYKEIYDWWEQYKLVHSDRVKMPKRSRGGFNYILKRMKEEMK